MEDQKQGVCGQEGLYANTPVVASDHLRQASAACTEQGADEKKREANDFA